MPSKPQRIEVVLETLIESIALAEQMGMRVAAEAGFGDDDQYRIGLAVHEGVMNAFQYGNEQRRERKIHLAFELHEDKLVIHVIDQGAGCRIENVPVDSGRGVLLMKAFMDEVEVLSSEAGGAKLVMAKRRMP